MPDIYKVVRPDAEGRLLSVVLPRHLAAIYRNAAGRIMTVPEAMAFDNYHEASYFANSWLRNGVELQIWRATAKSTKAASLIISAVMVPPKESRPGYWTGVTLYMGSTDNPINPRSLPRSIFTRARDKLARKRTWSHHMKVDDTCVLLECPPFGSISCTDLRLVEQVFPPSEEGDE